MTTQEIARRILKTIDPEDDFLTELFRLAANDRLYEDWDACAEHCGVLTDLFEKTLTRKQRALWKALQDATDKREAYSDAHACSLTLEQMEGR